MTDEDEKTARGGVAMPPSKRAPIVRTTAPAGTPAKPADPFVPQAGTMIGGAGMRGPMVAAPRRNSSPAPQTGHSDRPMNGITPPRTVGGHTARLNVPADMDTEPPPSSMPMPSAGGPTIGGTVRMLTPPDLAADSAPAPLAAHVAPAPPPPAHLAPAAQKPANRASPTVRHGAPRNKPEAHAPPQVTSQPATAPSPSGSGTRPRIAWFSPMPVAVGIVSFALGCMIGLVTDTRIWRAHAAPVAAPAAEASTAVAATTKPTATAVAPASTSVATVVPAAATATAPSAAPQPVPTPPAPPRVARPRQPPPPPPPPPGGKKPSRPGLPFD